MRQKVCRVSKGAPDGSPIARLLATGEAADQVRRGLPLHHLNYILDATLTGVLLPGEGAPSPLDHDKIEGIMASPRLGEPRARAIPTRLLSVPLLRPPLLTVPP